MIVRAKKRLGQHFLKDENIASEIVGSLSNKNLYSKVLEIGPGMGVLTKYLIKEKDYETTVIDIDRESVSYLQEHFPELGNRIISGDFLRLNLADIFKEPFAIIGNFPYNISSQILFKVLENRDLIPLVVGMFQKEVAERIAAPPKNKTYGILSVFMQAFYDVEYLLTVNENVFIPPPKVKSAVLRFTRNTTKNLDCNETLFFKVVKTGFNQRRKTLRNSLKSLLMDYKSFQDDYAGLTKHDYFNKRAEELSVAQFTELTNLIEKS